MKTTRRTLRRIFIFLFSFSLSLTPFVKGVTLSFLSPLSEIELLAEKQKTNPKNEIPRFFSLEELASELRWRNLKKIEPLIEKVKKEDELRKKGETKGEGLARVVCRLREAYRDYHSLQLDPSISADQILEFIEKNLKKPQILDSEVLFKFFPIMFRWLKENDWNVAQNSNLGKTKIYFYLFNSLFKDWKKLDILGEESAERKRNLEKLFLISLFHLYDVDGITNFSEIVESDAEVDVEDIEELRAQKFYASSERSTFSDSFSFQRPYANFFPEGIAIKSEKIYLLGADLSGIDFTADAGLSFIDESLPFVDFRGSKLQSIKSSDLTGALLIDTNLKSLDARGADLRFADFSRASLSGANLDNAILSGATLQDADFSSISSSSGLSADESLEFYGYSQERRLNYLRGPLGNPNLYQTTIRGTVFVGCELDASIIGLNKAIAGLSFDPKGRVGYYTMITPDQRKFFNSNLPDDSFEIFSFPSEESTPIATSL